MAKHVQSGTSFVQNNITGNNGSWLFSKSANIYSGTFGIFEGNARHGNQITVNGMVNSGSTAINLFGTNTDIIIGKTGMISGLVGILLGGTGDSLVNHGRVLTQSYGVYCTGAESSVTNDGTVNSVFGIYMVSAGGRLVNEESGRITGSTYGVIAAANAGDHTTTVNHGSIRSADIGYFSTDGNDKVINDGILTGSISLGAGKDLFDNRGGKVDHDIAGGLGNDTLIVDRAGTKLLENASEGTDRVKSTVSYELSDNVENLILLGAANINGEGNASANRLDGNSGNNRLSARGGTDVLNGHAGNDRLTGGGADDTFIFARHGDHDVITDFDYMVDYIVLSHLDGIDRASDLKHHVTFSGGDTIITAGSDVLTILNLSKAEFEMAHILFPVL